MKRAYFFMAGLLSVLMLGAIVPVHAVDPDTLYVRYIEGAVHLSEAGSAEAMEAVVNTPLIEGDAVATGPDGKAELFLKDGSMVRAGKNSALRITGINDRGIQFNLRQGTAYVVSRGSREVPIFFETPRASLDISSSSTVRIDAYSNGINEVSVLKGSIFTSDRSGRMLVRQGERLVLKADGTMPAVAALRAPDEWLQWNASRDGATIVDAAAGDSYAYLPEELRTYSPDLDANGEWIYTPEYEYVWVPTVIVVGTWSPYRYGRWAWIGGNYVWIGFEPWGWVPYHYGRWVHHGRAGWCWVPPRHRDVRWEPAHVAWVHSSRQIGWVPLAPGERYDRRTAPAFRRTNVFNVTHDKVTIERLAAAARTTYRNAAVANSMVTVERDRMLTRRTMNATAVHKGAVTMKKVSLPANITPARAPARSAGPQMAPAARASVAPSRVSAAGAKDLTGNGANTLPAGAGRLEVTTRQMPGMPLNSRIENARNTGRKDAPPVAATRGTPETRKETVPSHAPTVAPLRERVEAMSAPSAKPGNPTSARTSPTRPPARETVQAVRASTVNPVPSAQASRPAFTEKRQSPAVAAPASPPAAPVPRQPVAFNQPARKTAPQGISQRQTPSPAPARVNPPAPDRSPVPQAAVPSKIAPAPASSPKNDHKAGPDKNNKPHA